jgi:hypothetical protein
MSWLVCGWSIFGAQMNHGHTWTHNIHHDLNKGEATTFPLIGVASKCHFFSGLPTWESGNPRNWDSLHFGGPQLIV